MPETLLEALNSDRPFVCVVQGGGMRGTYSIAALAELEAHGFTRRFSAMYGSSAGSLNSAYFVAGQAEEGVGIYVDHLSGDRFIRPSRVRPIIDIDYLIDDVLTHSVPLHQQAVFDSPTELVMFLTDAQTGEGERFSSRQKDLPLMEVLRATAALPIVFAREIPIGGRLYADGGLYDQVPLLDALADGWRDIVVILTRPNGHQVKPLAPPTQWLMKAVARLFGHSAGIVRLLGSDRPRMRRVMAIASGAEKEERANIWFVCPVDGERIASRLTNSKSLLTATADAARADVQAALSRGPVTGPNASR